MRGRRREPEQRVLLQRVRVDVVRRPAGRRLRTDARPDAGADTSPDLCAQSEPDAAPERAPGAAANATAQPAADAHALVSKKDAAADPSAIAAPYT